eukprot:TRINITY_DN13923_c0_g1_i1.p1 TRINITY_DN13923_c0_g1~~TRINITY_DN13923_c0_g1_i1.p1  ORF type:complete len:179 (-),score=13.56 TRINITY_DN13923_c0_g1_i1:67-603(-)
MLESPVPLISDRRVVFLNGTLHLLGRPRSVLIIDVKGVHSTHVINLPEDLPTIVFNPSVECLGESGGHLCFAYLDDENSQIRIWVLEDYYETKWVLRHSNSVEALQEQHTEEIWSLRFLAFHPDDEVIFIKINYKIFPYRLSSGKLEESWSLDCKHREEPYFWAFPFSSCLYPLKDND